MPAVNKVLVVGGGIGGLTAGVALRQAGIEVDLIEIHPEFRVYGVGIIQPNNTLRALDKIGLAKPCVDEGAPFKGWQLFDAAGGFLMEAPTPNEGAPQYPPVNGITRPKLHEILSAAAAAEGVNITFDETVESSVGPFPGYDVRTENESFHETWTDGVKVWELKDGLITRSANSHDTVAFGINGTIYRADGTIAGYLGTDKIPSVDGVVTIGYMQIEGGRFQFATERVRR